MSALTHCWDDVLPKARLLPNQREYEQWLGGIVYLNATFHLRYAGDDHTMLDISTVREPSPGTAMELLDGDEFTVHSYHVIPFGLTHDDFIERVFLGVVYLEEHEASEAFLVEGDARFHPHRPGHASRVVIPPRLRGRAS